MVSSLQHLESEHPPKYPTKYRFKEVLDKGFVAITEISGCDASIARDARVQPESEWRPDKGDGGFNDERLLKTLMHSWPPHSTPFEKTSLQFWVKAPIFVYREWHRHRVWSFNEESARYKKLKPHFYVPEAKHVGVQSGSNHQSRDIDFESDGSSSRLHVDAMRGTYAHVYSVYTGLLNSGVPREIARSILPVGVYSEMVARVNLWNFFKFVELRNHKDAQYEIQMYARAMYDLVKESGRFKHTLKLWETRGASK